MTNNNARPYVLLSVAASIDGYIDDATPNRLLLSNDEDFDRVDQERAGVDAILVGANTIAADNPRLMVRSEDRRRTRVQAGATESPIKVTVTRGGTMLDPQAKFFSTGDQDKLVYTTSSARTDVAKRLENAATVIDAGDPLDLNRVLGDLARRGVQRLMVEGGSQMHTSFLSAGLADEVHLVVAPFLIGHQSAPRFVGIGEFPQGPDNPFRLADVERIGEVVLLRYLAPTQ
ncbi:RibD family protein [Glycomyces sp. MUSA5-2]|uniref:RibD family protein n=1 Tax=Glycomyces sp. MUSA5-2 TaxID=2053002 RepID=UPI0030094204